MKKIAIIPARAGSKGLPNKNILDFCGKPLIAHTIEQAINAKCFDEIICTSDGDEILEIAKNHGVVAFRRPPELATDFASANDYILHVLENIKTDVFMLLQPTSPIRLISDITTSLRLFLEKPDYNLISVVKAEKSPYFSIIEKKHGLLQTCSQIPVEISRRQDAPICYNINGSIYIWKTEIFLKNPKTFYPESIIYEMPKERSVDIDDILDFKLAEIIYSSMKF